ncbi:MAG: hypothetical protein O7G30_03635 [Proteobacteria bacterium]|nr:hypothetical protein [Pseudomonadota bacterium]
MGRIRYAVGVALRSGATPLLLGLRWARGAQRDRQQHVPPARWNVKLASKAALDELFFATELASGPFLRIRDLGRAAAEIDAALAFFRERGWDRRPAEYHATPPPARQPARVWRRSPWGEYQHLQFDSGYEPYLGEPGRTRWLSYRANRRAHAWLLEHRGAPRPWLVCVPGYRMGRPSVDFTGFRARWLHHGLGLNVAIPVMPLHGPRRVGRRGGDGFFSGDFVDTVHAQAQAVWDTRRLIGWLRRRGEAPVGAYGISLGGCTTGLLAGLEADLDCVIVGIPATDFTRLLRNQMPEFVARAVERTVFPLAQVEELLRLVSPLAIPRRVPRERCFLYAAVADRLASPDQARDLWEHWGRPHLEWYEGSHVSFLWEKTVKSLIVEALDACGMSPRESG